jgi:hypothetical protein
MNATGPHSGGRGLTPGGAHGWVDLFDSEFDTMREAARDFREKYDALADPAEDPAA